METIQPQEESLDQDNISNTFQEGDYIYAKISRYEWCMAKVTKVYHDTKNIDISYCGKSSQDINPREGGIVAF